MIRVVLVDDHTIVREGTRALLEGAGDFSVVGEAASAAECRALLRRLWPAVDVLVLDLGLPDQSGVELAAAVLAEHPSLPVVVLTAHGGTAYRVRLMDLGITAFLDKAAGREELVQTLRSVAAGTYVITQPVREAMRRWGNRRGPGLTAREREVLTLVAEGLANKEIAARLLVSERTIEFHVANVLSKLDTPSRVAAVRRARQEGWLVDE